MNHKKHTAKQNAAGKITARDHLSEEPKLPLSEKQISQGRFAGETPLTGEDRPADQPGDKQEGFSGDKAAAEAAVGHPGMRSQENATMPRPRSTPPDAAKASSARNP